MTKGNNNNYVFEGIRLKKKQQKIVTLLSSCKEIRDTAYPLNNSSVTELIITKLNASKQKGYTYLSGSLSLQDGTEQEERTFVAYLTEKNNEYHILLDITRNIDGEKKMIRTTDIISEEENNIVSHTSYCSIGFLQEKVFSEEFPKDYLDSTPVKTKQLSAL